MQIDIFESRRDFSGKIRKQKLKATKNKRHLKNCIDEKKRLRYAVNQGILRALFSKLFQFWEKRMGDLPLCMHARLQVYKVLRKSPFELRDFLRNESHIHHYVTNTFHAKNITSMKYWNMNNFCIWGVQKYKQV